MELVTKKKSLIEEAEEILTFLNKKAGKRFPIKHRRTGKPTTSLNMVVRLLEDGYEPHELKQVIAMKCREWKDTEMKVWLRPKTLFGVENFEGYFGSLEVEE